MPRDAEAHTRQVHLDRVRWNTRHSEWHVRCRAGSWHSRRLAWIPMCTAAQRFLRVICSAFCYFVSASEFLPLICRHLGHVPLIHSGYLPLKNWMTTASSSPSLEKYSSNECDSYGWAPRTANKYLLTLLPALARQHPRLVQLIMFLRLVTRYPGICQV